jgi:hypothetical protein
MLSIPFKGNGADKISAQQTIASGILKNFGAVFGRRTTASKGKNLKL